VKSSHVPDICLTCEAAELQAGIKGAPGVQEESVGSCQCIMTVTDQGLGQAGPSLTPGSSFRALLHQIKFCMAVHTGSHATIIGSSASVHTKRQTAAKAPHANRLKPIIACKNTLRTLSWWRHGRRRKRAGRRTAAAAMQSAANSRSSSCRRIEP
jgi:hypothetical protein